MQKGQNLSGTLPREPPQRLRYESVEELTDPHLYFTIFENSILVQKTDINRTAWINSWYSMSMEILYKLFLLI